MRDLSGVAALSGSIGGSLRLEECAAEVRHDGAIGGDVQVQHCGGAVAVSQVGGSLRVSDGDGGIGATSVGGDVLVNDARGDVRVEHVGGNAAVRRVAGEVRLPHVGGDARLVEAAGTVDVSVSGSAYYAGSPRGELSVRLHADGQLLLALDPNADVTLTLTFEQGVELTLPLADEQRDGGRVGGRLGPGAARLDADANGRTTVVRATRRTPRRARVPTPRGAVVAGAGIPATGRRRSAATSIRRPGARSMPSASSAATRTWPSGSPSERRGKPNAPPA